MSETFVGVVVLTYVSSLHAVLGMQKRHVAQVVTIGVEVDIAKGLKQLAELDAQIEAIQAKKAALEKE